MRRRQAKYRHAALINIISSTNQPTSPWIKKYTMSLFVRPSLGYSDLLTWSLNNHRPYSTQNDRLVHSLHNEKGPMSQKSHKLRPCDSMALRGEITVGKTSDTQIGYKLFLLMADVPGQISTNPLFRYKKWAFRKSRGTAKREVIRLSKRSIASVLGNERTPIHPPLSGYSPSQQKTLLYPKMMGAREMDKAVN